MTLTAFAAGADRRPDPNGAYRAGVCNIGPAEIARRRQAGHMGVLVTLAAFAILVLIEAPPWTRLVLFVPAAGAASGYLQAALKFCAGFGSRGVFNFGPLGDQIAVGTPEDRASDRRRSWQIGLASFGIGAVVAIVATLLPG